MTARRAYVVESALGERRTVKAERERTRLIEHFAGLRRHVHALTVQVMSLGGKPVPMPVATLDDTDDAEAYLGADLEARPVSDEDVVKQRRNPSLRTRHQVQAFSTRARIEAFMRARPGEHALMDIATAIGSTRAAVTVALSKGKERFERRKLTQSAQGGPRVLYRLADSDEKDDDQVAEA